ncbi:MAG: DinB family protein [Balneolaceae bacterium]|nr:DinB family protein [Balneolaceae bacterium]
MKKRNSFVINNIHFLQQGVNLLQRIDDSQYVDGDSPYYNSGIGKHMRHILDHYECFLKGLPDRIDYDARDRETKTETDRSYAIQKARTFIDQLRTIADNADLLDRNVQVKSNEEGTEEISPWSRSTVKRELQFLISHTVHHFALIGFILRTHGIEIPDDFGVAPSTLRYQNEQGVEEQS